MNQSEQASKEKTPGKKRDFLDLLLIRRIYSLATPYKKFMVIAVALTLMLAVVGPLRPYLIQYTLDHHVAQNDAEGLLNMTLILVGLVFFHTLVQFFQTYATNWLGQSVIKDLRGSVYAHLTRLKLKFYDKTPVGTLVTRNINDIETIADVFSEGLITISGDILQLLFVIIIMFYTDWKLSLISLSVLPLLLFSSYIFKEKVKKSFNDVRTQVSRLNAFVQEHITGMQIVQIFNREELELKKFTEINKDHRDANIRSVLYYSIFFPVVEVITAVSIGLLVWWGTKGVIHETVTPGMIVAFILYINMFFRPIRQLADRFNSLQMGMVAAERIFKLLDDTTYLEKTGILEPEYVKGDVSFKNVWFAYKNDDYVLKDISFELKAGKTLALVGATGAGKSSIINLLSRFYELNKGEILIDGININDFDIHHLRKKISVVLQDVFLFSGTVEENIRLYNEDISPEKVREAARLVGADKFISQLQDGFHTRVMERGSSLSVGQRQMISFVRALAFDPSILVLDEATSSVDSETEELIQHAISVLLKNRTSIVIAHRLSTIRNVDEIMVLDKGRIVERGTHEELIALEGYYHKLYEHQVANSSMF